MNIIPTKIIPINLKLKKWMLIQMFFVIFCLDVSGQIDNSKREIIKKAFRAKTITECQSSLKFCNEVLKIVPNHPVINYLTARLNAKLGNNKIALDQLNRAIELGYTTKLPFHKINHLNDSAFFHLRDDKEFSSVIESLKKAEEHVHNSEIAFHVDDKKLTTEGITYDPIEKVFYMGSMTKNKIVKVDTLGNSTDFTQSKQDGLDKVLGIHVDPIRRTLWACSVSEESTGVYKFNLNSGKLIKKYLLSSDSKKHAFNDLVIHLNGDVYITDPPSSSIYMISMLSDSLELYLNSKSFFSLNGITISDDNRDILVADFDIGIYTIEINSKHITLLAEGKVFSSFGIDGMYAKGNKIYAVQIGLNQISEFTFNSSAKYLEKCEIIERNTPELIGPTTGVIVDNYFYYITDDGGEVDNARGIIIMKTSLDINEKTNVRPIL